MSFGHVSEVRGRRPEPPSAMGPSPDPAKYHIMHMGKKMDIHFKKI